MNRRCTNCGAELFEGQQFCRRCGWKTGDLGTEAPTRVFDEAPPAPGTTVLPPRGTGETAWRARHTEHHGPVGHPLYTSQLPAAEPEAAARKRPRWLVPLLLGVLLVAFVGAAGVIFLGRSPIVRKVVMRADGPREPGGGFLDEAGAVVTSGETVITKTFALAGDAAFSIKNVQGDITVEGWDGEEVELKVTKTGGTAAEREGARLTLRQTEGQLAVGSDDKQIKVAFEVRVPRSLRKVELTSRSGDVRVEGLEAPLSLSLTNGDARLEDLQGEVEAELVNGDVEVVYRGPERAGAHDISTVNGAVTVRLAEDMNADLKASVVNGKIDVEEELGFRPQKKQAGASLDARLGEGGEPLTVKSVNGQIRFER